MSKIKKIKVVELFAGVGGFRVGLEGYPPKKASKYKIVWSNQWEPSTKVQHANQVYRFKFNKYEDSIHSEENITNVQPSTIPIHDMIVGGFPCQDFSVGALNKLSKGLKGKKGVLWYEIKRILSYNVRNNKPTKYLLLENVDRLLKCPVNLKGGDFITILKDLNSLGYALEWKVINAGDYNMPQRRKRLFIIGYHKSTDIYIAIKNDKENWLNSTGIFASTFKSNYECGEKRKGKISEFYAIFKDRIEKDDSKLSEFKRNKILAQDKKIPSPFYNSGIMIKNYIITTKHLPIKIKNKNPISKFIEKNKELIPKQFIVDKMEFKEKWKVARGAKTKIRKSDDGRFTYKWSEGGMSEVDSLDKPARTIITSEGGRAPSRTKHIIKYGKKYRRLLPSELEQLNMFEKNFTKYGLDRNGKIVEISSNRRAFLMGNALVVGVIKKLGDELAKRYLK